MPLQGIAGLWGTGDLACTHAGHAGKGVSPAEEDGALCLAPLRRQIQNINSFGYSLA